MFDRLTFVIDKLRLLARQTIPGVRDLMVDYEDAERLVAEIDRLRAPIATKHTTGTVAVTTTHDDRIAKLLSPPDGPEPPTWRHCNVNEAGPNCCFGRCQACCRDPECEDHGKPPPTTGVPDDPDMLSEFTDDELPRF